MFFSVLTAELHTIGWTYPFLSLFLNFSLFYYSSPEHAETDQFGIHTTICSLLKEIRTPVAVMGSERERIKREHQKEKIMVSEQPSFSYIPLHSFPLVNSH